MDRPVVYVYSIPGCRPCQWLKADVEKGVLNDFKIEFREPPEWALAEGLPILHYQARDGTWKKFLGWDRNGAADRFRKRWTYWNK